MWITVARCALTILIYLSKRHGSEDRGNVIMPTDFTEAGLLPPGDYHLTLNQLRESLLVVGPPRPHRRWNREGRLRLVDNLAIMADHLWQVGVEDIYVDGSFVEDKASPNDIDGYFVCTVTQYQLSSFKKDLALLDDIWTWDDAKRTRARNTTKPQLPMWHKYRVELYPELGDPANIPGPNGANLSISAGFRQERWTFTEKGIVHLVQ